MLLDLTTFREKLGKERRIACTKMLYLRHAVSGLYGTCSFACEPQEGKGCTWAVSWGAESGDWSPDGSSPSESTSGTAHGDTDLDLRADARP